MFFFIRFYHNDINNEIKVATSMTLYRFASNSAIIKWDLREIKTLIHAIQFAPCSSQYNKQNFILTEKNSILLTGVMISKAINNDNKIKRKFGLFYRIAPFATHLRIGSMIGLIDRRVTYLFKMISIFDGGNEDEAFKAS